MRVTAPGFEVGFGARHKEAARAVKAMQPLEVDIPSVHDVERAGLGQQQVQHIDIVKLAVAEVQKRGNVAAQIQQRVQLDGRFGRAKWRPRKHRQAQIDGADVESVDRFYQIDAKRFSGIQTEGDPDE